MSEIPAFPVPGCPGMTLRDYFAAAALKCVGGHYSNTVYPNEEHDRETHEYIVNHAYGIADAMLKRRES